MGFFIEVIYSRASSHQPNKTTQSRRKIECNPAKCKCPWSPCSSWLRQFQCTPRKIQACTSPMTMQRWHLGLTKNASLSSNRDRTPTSSTPVQVSSLASLRPRNRLQRHHRHLHLLHRLHRLLGRFLGQLWSSQISI